MKKIIGIAVLALTIFCNYSTLAENSIDNMDFSLGDLIKVANAESESCSKVTTFGITKKETYLQHCYSYHWLTGYTKCGLRIDCGGSGDGCQASECI